MWSNNHVDLVPDRVTRLQDHVDTVADHVDVVVRPR